LELLHLFYSKGRPLLGFPCYSQYEAEILPEQEGLAVSFEAMSLLEDALMQYDELEVSFFQVMHGERYARFLYNHQSQSLSTFIFIRPKSRMVWKSGRYFSRGRLVATSFPFACVCQRLSPTHHGQHNHLL
jgi:hypothetical protein